jgi:hypothetical protein
MCVYSISQHQIEVNDRFHPVAASCHCPLYRRVAGRRNCPVARYQNLFVESVISYLMNELSMLSFDAMAVLLMIQYTVFFSLLYV